MSNLREQVRELFETTQALQGPCPSADRCRSYRRPQLHKPTLVSMKEKKDLLFLLFCFILKISS